MEPIDLTHYLELVGNLIIEYGARLAGAVLALIIGMWLINKVVFRLSEAMRLKNIEPSLIPFLRSVLNIGLKVALVISIAGMVGIEMTSFVAILGAAGLAVGLAMQGTLQNFAGGVMILLFKPYKVGDYIEAAGHDGTVKEIQIFNTILNTPDNKIIIIPNGSLANSSMVNYSMMPTRQVDFTFGISYGDDFDKAKGIIQEIIAKDERILKDPAPFTRVGALADSSVNITTRVWVKSENYWDVYFDMIENVKRAFDANQISIPFPQMDVHMGK